MKLIVMSGLPGSGKSTKAQHLAGLHNAVYVGWDSEATLFPNLGSTDMVYWLIRCVSLYLSQGTPVVVDACNLHPHDRIRWESVAACHDVGLDWHFVNTPVQECIKRDAKRPTPVGAERILSMAKEYGLGSPLPKMQRNDHKDRPLSHSLV